MNIIETFAKHPEDDDVVDFLEGMEDPPPITESCSTKLIRQQLVKKAEQVVMGTNKPEEWQIEKLEKYLMQIARYIPPKNGPKP